MFKKYKTIVFDCDGVILDSNKIKSQAFYDVAIEFGEQAAKQLLDYHIQRGGISRFLKFEWFVKTVLKKEDYEGLVSILLQKYADIIERELLLCSIAESLDIFREKTKYADWMVVSGGKQEELISLFTKRKINHLFNKGIFGSPDPKNVIIEREINNGNIIFPALYIGDSKYDYEVSTLLGLEFVFLKNWTEFKEWESFFKDKNIHIFDNIKAII
jgi:haloacid dehalogenase domain protein hydrolase